MHSAQIKPNSPQLRLLIVEDDPIMRIGLTQCLGDVSHFEVVGQASDGYQAIALVESLKPHLVVMDIGLPQLDGIEATQRIKAEQPDLQVVMLTSHNTPTEMLAALASGADAYCIKGSQITELLAAIAAIQEGGLYLDAQIARAALSHVKSSEINKTDINLSERELVVLHLLVEGNSNGAISEKLHISTSTVKTHIHSIMNKLAVNNRVQTAVVALRSGLV
jgi:two-component system, NarL family, response regulator LiaR